MKQIIFIMLAIMIVSCQTRLVPYSNRPMNLEKISDSGKIPTTDVESHDTPAPLYKSNNEVVIKKADNNQTGSLYPLGSNRNDLFRNKFPLVVGDNVIVAVSSTRLEAKKNAPAEGGAKGGEAPEGSPKGPDAAQSKAADGASDDVIAALKKAVPSLDPMEEKGEILRKIKFRILKINEMGDATVGYSRSSENGVDNNRINVKTTIPYAMLQKENGVTTDDLADVHWEEWIDGQKTIRNSEGWEDEYTLRLSGFNEARSRYAMELEAKRQQLIDIKKLLEAKMKTFSNERKFVAKERESLQKAKASFAKEKQELEELRTKVDADNKKSENSKTSEPVVEKGDSSKVKAPGNEGGKTGTDGKATADTKSTPDAKTTGENKTAPNAKPVADTKSAPDAKGAADSKATSDAKTAGDAKASPDTKGATDTKAAAQAKAPATSAASGG